MLSSVVGSGGQKRHRNAGLVGGGGGVNIALHRPPIVSSELEAGDGGDSPALGSKEGVAAILPLVNFSGWHLRLGHSD